MRNNLLQTSQLGRMHFQPLTLPNNFKKAPKKIIPAQKEINSNTKKRLRKGNI